MARIISIVNQKGGTGKSACTANLAVGLAQKNMKVLIVDADPQSDVSAGFGYRDCDDSNETLTALMDAVVKDEDIPSDCYIRHQAEGIDIICSNIGLAGTEVQLVNAMSREYVLKQILYGIKDQYDAVIIDCMPSLGMITINALAASDEVLIPVEASYLPIKGLQQLLKTIGKVRKQINPKLQVGGILFTMVDAHTNDARNNMELLRNVYGSQIHIFDNYIPFSVRMKEAVREGQSIFSYDPKGKATLLDLLNESETREEDETYQNPVDMMFQELEERDPQHFAVRQYKKYKMAAGKTAKSILISCGARLAPFDIAELREIMSYDEMELDKIGDRKTALFLIMSDTDTTFNFVIAMLQSQLFNLLCDKADDEYGGRLPVHVRVIADEFANIGQIPQFDKLIATIRSREISASIILQSQSQLKAMYKDSADTILGNCDTTLFLGGKEKTTLKEMSELLGKETIDLYNTSETRSNQKSFGLNYQKTGKQLMTEDEIAVMDGGKCILQIRGARPFFSDKYDITKHKNYRLLADENEKNRYKVEKELNPQYTPKSEEEVEVIHVELSE